ncbi:hypothetical protein CGC48_10250 [Capnocytophaga cynodegmi]|uniref:Inner membrane protein ykgB n=1 Tax=Capnocytophaga cynodegmi TaxID=28189 RepID=A0A250E7M3_9FLAO|nr:DUF417 family protein [Capnocytophaga cynodegmi]ATA68964.1 hypothetical protein CGC48_10250 [Capnocytophaga cynodegmi]
MEKQTSNCLLSDEKIYKVGYYVSLFGTALLLLWIGIFKFTTAEANAVKPLIENHFLTFWVYNLMSVQTVSNIVGAIEIMLALLLLFSPFFPKLGRYAAYGMIVTFLVTISYLFTTPNMWRKVEWMPVTDFFILKDVVLLGFSLMLVKETNKNN